jgi:hypothetical protein
MLSKTTLTVVATAFMALAFESAQAQSSPPATGTDAGAVSRDQRKSDTAAANQAGTLTPAGQGVQPTKTPTTSTMTREQRKAQANADAKAGKMTPAGGSPAHTEMTHSKSTLTREQRKAQANADAKARKMTPAGEGAAQK